MPQLDAATFLPQLFWLAVSFGVLYLILSRVALPRVGEVLEERRARIVADLARADDLRREAEATLEAHERTMAEARGEARRIVAEAARAAAAESERRHAELAARLESESARAGERIAAARDETLAGLRAGAADAVRAAGGKVAGVALSDSVIAAALEEE